MQNWEMNNYAVYRLWIIIHCIGWGLETWIFYCITKIVLNRMVEMRWILLYKINVMLNRNRQIVSLSIDEASEASYKQYT